MKPNFSAWKNVGTVLCGVAVVAQLIAFVTYLATGKTEFTPELSPLVLVFGALVLLCGVGIAVCKLFGVFTKWLDVALSIVALFSLFAFLMYMTSEVNYIANILVSIDGTAVSASFVITALFYLISWATAMAAAVVSKYQAKGETV